MIINSKKEKCIPLFNLLVHVIRPISGTNGWSENNLGEGDQESFDNSTGSMQRWRSILSNYNLRSADCWVMNRYSLPSKCLFFCLVQKQVSRGRQIRLANVPRRREHRRILGTCAFALDEKWSSPGQNSWLLSIDSPFKMRQRSLKKGDERKAEHCSFDANSSPLPKSAGKGDR